MRILIVSQYFWPENFRINDLCAELVRRGHEVTVLTGKPNYPDGEVFPDYLSSPGRFNEYQGCQVVRVPMISRGKGSSGKLLINYLTYVFSASTWGIFKLRKHKFDVVFVCQLSPITVALPAIVYKMIYKKPVVMWVLDLWPETLEAIGVVKSPKILSWVGRLVSFIYNRCDLILGQSKTFFNGINKYCQDKSRIKYFPSWSESIFINSVAECREEIIQYRDCFNVLFAGNVGDAQDFTSILNAAELLKQRNALVKFFIVGDGRMFDWVKVQIKERDLEGVVILLGRYPLDSMPSFYASADALLVSLKSSEIFAMTIPGKVQSYMVAGKPILAMLDGEGARIIRDAKAGLVCSSGDFEGLADNALKMSKLNINELSEMADNGKFFADKEFDRDKLISQLEEWFLEVSKLSVNSQN